MKRIEAILLDRVWIDPVLAVALGTILALPIDGVTRVNDRGSFFETLAGLVGTLLTLAVLAITISLSRDLSPHVREQLRAASRGLVGSLFGSLAWMVLAALLACAAFVIGSLGVPSWLLSGYVAMTVLLCLLPTIRIGLFLAKLFSLELASRA